MKANVKKFAAGFSVIYWITILSNILGNYAYLAATPNKRAAFHIGWSLSLGELGFVIALVAGLIIGNFFPTLARFLSTAAKPEWYIKTGIVILGANIGIQAISALGLASTVILRGLCAVVEAYLIYWPVVYFVARKFFKFTPEWAAPHGLRHLHLRGGSRHRHGQCHQGPADHPHHPGFCDHCIRRRGTADPALCSGLFPARRSHGGRFLAGACGKSDGGAVASGAIADSLIRSRALELFGVKYQEGWILMAATTSKVFIDIFIGIWSFILAVVWSIYHLNNPKAAGSSGRVSKQEIWNRFPKFILGFVVTLVGIFLAGWAHPGIVAGAKAGAGQANLLRAVFFGLCFFSIGLVTNVRKLWNA